MSEPNTVTPAIKPDAPVHESMARCAAIVTASIALGGFIIWSALGGAETYPDAVASIARDSDMRRMMFTEKGRQLYVAVPENAVEPPKVAPPQLGMVVVPARSAKAKPMQVPTATTAQVTEDISPAARPADTTPAVETSPAVSVPAPSEPTQTASAETSSEPAPTTRDLDAAYEPKPSESVRYASTLDEQLASRPARHKRMRDMAPADDDDEPSSYGPPPPDDDHDGSWEDEPSAEPIMDEPPPDDPYEEDDHS